MCPPLCGWGSSNMLRDWMEHRCGGRKNSAWLLGWDMSLILPSVLLLLRPSDQNWNLYYQFPCSQELRCRLKYTTGSPKWRSGQKILELLSLHNCFLNISCIYIHPLCSVSFENYGWQIHSVSEFPNGCLFWYFQKLL